MAAAFTLAATSAGSASSCELWVVLVPDFDVEVVAATATALPPRPSAPMAVAVVTVLRILVLSMGAFRTGWLAMHPTSVPHPGISSESARGFLRAQPSGASQAPRRGRTAGGATACLSPTPLQPP